MTTNLIYKYVWLVDTIYRAGRISLKEINECWLHSSLSDGEEIPRRTFNNQRGKIEQIFGLRIECDIRHGYRYYIENAEDIRSGSLQSWLLDTFAVSNLVNDSQSIRERIVIESIPSGQQHLETIIEAMLHEQVVSIESFHYWSHTPRRRCLAPYFVQMSQRRWYVVGKDLDTGEMAHQSLDRITDLTVTDTPYEFPLGFHPKDYGKDYFGVFREPGVEPERVVIRMYENQQYYARSLPLHHSQVETETTEDYSTFEYYVAPTYDFRQEILRHGSAWEVLEPQHLRDEIADAIKMGYELYFKPKE